MTVAAPTKSTQLIDPQFMSRLHQLRVLSRKLLAGKLKGERRSKRRGQSVEFADYRNYSIGDDLRFIDWNIYARLDKLFLKLFLGRIYGVGSLCGQAAAVPVRSVRWACLDHHRHSQRHAKPLYFGCR